MMLGLLAALTAAVCYGVGSVLQAVGARRPAVSVIAVTRSRPYLIGIGLDVAAFLVSTVALRRLPLFSVQATVASSVVVTAVLAIPVLGARLRPGETAAIATVCAGLVLLGMSSSPAPTRVGAHWLPAAALAAAVLTGLAGAVALSSNRSGPTLGLLAGLAFGLVGLSVRLLAASGSLVGWLTDPAVYSLALSGALALFLYAAALQRSHVTTTTAVVVAVDALLPALVGVLLLGDRAAPGRGWLAVLGFLATVCGAVAVSRFGADAQPDPARDEPLDQRKLVPVPAGRTFR